MQLTCARPNSHLTSSPSSTTRLGSCDSSLFFFLSFFFGFVYLFIYLVLSKMIGHRHWIKTKTNQDSKSQDAQCLTVHLFIHPIQCHYSDWNSFSSTLFENPNWICIITFELILNIIGFLTNHLHNVKFTVDNYRDDSISFRLKWSHKLKEIDWWKMLIEWMSHTDFVFLIFFIGDITQKGYEKKRSRLLAPYIPKPGNYIHIFTGSLNLSFLFSPVIHSYCI